MASELAEVLADQVSDTVRSLAESQSKELIDRLVEDIEQKIDVDGEVLSSDGENRELPPTPVENTPEAGDYVVSIRNGETVADDNQSDVTAGAVNYLIQNLDLISAIEPLPYIPGREKAIINNSPTSPHDAEAMRAHRELVNGYYLDTHANRRGKMRVLEGVTDECGLDVSF